MNYIKNKKNMLFIIKCNIIVYYLNSTFPKGPTHIKKVQSLVPKLKSPLGIIFHSYIFWAHHRGKI